MVRSWRWALVLLAAGIAGGAWAQAVRVTAATDRSSVRENESFTFTLRVEGSVRGEPDTSPLEADFDVLNRSTSTRIQIVNGRTEQVAEWQMQLMPRRAGRVTIPALEVGGVASNPLELEVLPAPPPGDAVADIFMEVEALPANAYVQSQVVFTLRLFIGVGTGRATLTTPEIAGVEAIVERLGEDAQYQTVRDGRSFVVRERRYAVFPQAAGMLEIGPVTFEAMVIPNRGFSRVQRFRSETVRIDVQPAVAPPAQFPRAVWLPASRVEISERWSDDVDALQLGIPQTRTLTIEADGLLETQLPDLDMAVTDGIRQYADQPELDRTTGPDGLTAQRIERFAVIAQREGAVELPAIELPWWNVNTARWEVARIPARTLEVIPSAEMVAPASAPPAAIDAPAAIVEPGPWRTISAALALGWALTGFAWWWLGRSRRAPAERRASAPAAGWHEDRRLMRELLQACDRNDAQAAQRLLLAWGAARLPKSPPTSVGALGAALPAEAAAAAAELEQHLYGPAPAAWDGSRLRRALGALQAVAKHGEHARADALLPLYR
jgi:hypothetical protein